MCPFDYTVVAVSGKVGILLTGLTTPIEWMLSDAILIDRPKSAPQLLCNPTLQYSKIHVLKLNIKDIGVSSFLVTQLFHLKYLFKIIFIGDYKY